MKIVVDTNIIFSALLNTNSTIGDLLFNSDKHFDFYSCSYMRYEIKKALGETQKNLQTIRQTTPGVIQFSDFETTLH